MNWLVWPGAALSFLGFLGILWTVIKVWKARKAGHEEDELREVIRGVIPVNMIALFVSVIGLMMVISGIALG